MFMIAKHLKVIHAYFPVSIFFRGNTESLMAKTCDLSGQKKILPKFSCFSSTQKNRIKLSKI